jgi:hypothetical protein
VNTHIDFDEQFRSFPEEVQNSIMAKSIFIQEIGHNLGRPHVDTLKGSKHSNMKELRLDAIGDVWRVAFAFDPERQAILLVAGDKTGKNQKRFYTKLFRTADMRFDEHLEYLKVKK